MSFTVLLYYKYINVPDPESECEAQRALCAGLGLKGRILIGTEGINGTVAGNAEAIRAYRKAMDAHPLFDNIAYKADQSAIVPFPRLRVKTRPEVVSLEVSVDLAKTAPKLSPTEFNQIIKDPDVVLFDARNNYESAIGRFKNAVTPDIRLFKELPDALKNYENLKNKKVVTYCTGGIRCEKASALMKQRGFKNVYQLDGGIINYAQAYPGGAFEGDCFVFDDRMKVSFKSNPEQLGLCIACSDSTNDYYNCAHKPCNTLMLVCADCRLQKEACSDTCEANLAATRASANT